MNNSLRALIVVGIIWSLANGTHAQELSPALQEIDKVASAIRAEDCEAVIRLLPDTIEAVEKSKDWSPDIAEIIKANMYGGLGNCHYAKGEDAAALAAYRQSATVKDLGDDVHVKRRITELEKK